MELRTRGSTRGPYHTQAPVRPLKPPPEPRTADEFAVFRITGEGRHRTSLDYFKRPGAMVIDTQVGQRGRFKTAVDIVLDRTATPPETFRALTRFCEKHALYLGKYEGEALNKRLIELSLIEAKVKPDIPGTDLAGFPKPKTQPIPFVERHDDWIF